MKRHLSFSVIVGLVVTLLLQPVLTVALSRDAGSATAVKVSLVQNLREVTYEDSANLSAVDTATSNHHDPIAVDDNACIHGHGACTITALPIFPAMTSAVPPCQPQVKHQAPTLALETPPPR